MRRVEEIREDIAATERVLIAARRAGQSLSLRLVIRHESAELDRLRREMDEYPAS